MKYLVGIAAFSLLLSCSQKTFEGNAFGAGITSGDYIEFAALPKQMGERDTLETTMLATVSEVCQAKGCWMTLTEEGVEDVMVKFKDYGFFVPKDIAGRQVIVEGVAYRTVVPVDELRHYAEDAGKSPEEIAQITEPEATVNFLASGVMLLDEEE